MLGATLAMIGVDDKAVLHKQCAQAQQDQE